MGKQRVFVTVDYEWLETKVMWDRSVLEEMAVFFPRDAKGNIMPTNSHQYYQWAEGNRLTSAAESFLVFRKCTIGKRTPKPSKPKENQDELFPWYTNYNKRA